MKRSIQREIRDMHLLGYLVSSWLLGFEENMIFQDKQVHLRCHETSVSICRSTDYGLTSDIEAGIDDYSTASLFLKFLDQAIISTIAIFRNGLNSSRVVDVSNRWDVGSFDPSPLKKIRPLHG